MANSPIRVMAMVMKSPMEVEFNSVNMVARSPDNGTQDKQHHAGNTEQEEGCLIPASNRRVEQTETPSQRLPLRS